MQLSVRAASTFLLIQTVATFQPTRVPRSAVAPLNSLLDEAYDIPSIASTYSRGSVKVEEAATAVTEVAKKIPEVTPSVKVEKAATAFAEVAKKIPKVTRSKPVIDTAEVATNIQSATIDASAKVSEASARASEASAKVSEASAKVSSSVEEFVKAANDNFPAAKSSVSQGLSTGPSGFEPLVSPLKAYRFEIPPAPPLEEGKARPMVDYFRDLMTGNSQLPSIDGETIADAKAKLALMASNSDELREQIASMTSIRAPAPIAQGLESLPPGAAGWIAAIAATCIALGQRNAGAVETKELMGDLVQKEAAAVSEIALQLKSMGQEIKKLNGETALLSKDLQQAKTKLTVKELALSKERLAAAEKELELNRAIDALKVKLKEAEQRLRLIDRAAEIEATSAVATVASVATPSPAPKAKPQKVRVVKKGEKAPAAAPTAKKATAKKATAKKATAKKATAKKAKTTEVKEGSWSLLSPSTLSRKTVKQLTEYLSAQGVPTVGEDGKILKKALLVEAVQAL